MSQINRPPSSDILNERGSILARNYRHLIPTIKKSNIKHDYDNDISVSNIKHDYGNDISVSNIKHDYDNDISVSNIKHDYGNDISVSNIKHDYDNDISVSNTSTHPNLMLDNQNEKPTLQDVYRTKSGCIVKKPKRYIDEM